MRQFSRNGANRANADENDLFKEDSGREHLMLTERRTVRCLHVEAVLRHRLRHSGDFLNKA